MGINRRLVNQLKRRARYMRRNRGLRRQDKINKNDEILSASQSAFKLVRKVERRIDRNFGIESIPAPDKILLEKLKKINTLDRHDFGSSDYGLRLQVTPATAAAYESFTVTFPATASATQGDYLYFTDPENGTYAAWLDIDANGTAPTGTYYTGALDQVKVSIATGDTAIQVAAAFVSAIGTVSGMTVTDNLDGTVTITSTLDGNLTDATTYNADDTGAGTISATVTTQGITGSDLISFKELGVQVGDIVQILEGTLKGKEYAVTAVVDDNTLRLEDDAAQTGTDSDIYAKFRLSSVKSTYY